MKDATRKSSKKSKNRRSALPPEVREQAELDSAARLGAAAQQALKLAESDGIPAINGPRGSKHPTVRGWPDAATADLDPLTEMTAAHPDDNYYLVMGNGFVAIDVDGPEGLKSIREAGLDLPDTYSQYTGGGGLHFVYRLPDGVRVGNRTGIFHKVDVRGDNGQIVCAGSQHPNGRIYEVANDGPVAYLPAAWIPCLISSRGSSATPQKVGIPKGKRNDTLFRTQAQPEGGNAIPEGRRNSTLMSLAGTMRRWV